MQQTYPVLIKPNPESQIVLPTSKPKNKKKKKGASELVDMAQIFRIGLKNIDVDVCIRIEGHNYEPDFAYIDEENGIYVDIEVDEPYTSHGKPTHYMLHDGSNSDSARNKRFTEAGWYVCRFTEHQIYCHTKSCLKEVLKLLLSDGLIKELPKKLATAPDLKPETRWTETDSRKLHKQKYRKSYLKYDPCSLALKDNLYCVWLTLPMFVESIWTPRLRKELFTQLYRYFFVIR